ncbi:hypothetical protein K1719_041703 [Acacia pycnantha]|nr:hypothetical protein K1719_041703 [Acacia pycnantha]
MSQQPQDQVLCTIDPYQHLQITTNPDGSINRLVSLPTTASSPNADTSSPVLSKDLPLNPNNATFLRLYLPHKAITSSSSFQKLPLIVYFHGGGFVLLSASSSMNHDFCSEMATYVAPTLTRRFRHVTDT